MKRSGVLVHKSFFLRPLRQILSYLSWSIPCIVLIVVILCFFQHPSMDDFVGSYLVAADGFVRSVERYMLNENGRLFTVPLFIFFTSFRFS